VSINVCVVSLATFSGVSSSLSSWALTPRNSAPPAATIPTRRSAIRGLILPFLKF
jgi:hypothetical protein